MGAAFLVTAIGFSAPAEAAVTRCISDGESDGAQIVPGAGGGQMTRAVTRQQAANTWDDWVWRGPEFWCPKGTTCDYAWEKSKSTTTGWNVGGGVELGNSSSPTKKWYNTVLGLVGGFGKQVTITTEYRWRVNMNGGDVAQPIQIARRRWTQGDFVGGWVRTNVGCQGGKDYEWQGAVRFGSWTTNQFQKEIVSYAVNGRVV